MDKINPYQSASVNAQQSNSIDDQLRKANELFGPQVAKDLGKISKFMPDTYNRLVEDYNKAEDLYKKIMSGQGTQNDTMKFMGLCDNLKNDYRTIKSTSDTIKYMFGMLSHMF